MAEENNTVLDGQEPGSGTEGGTTWQKKSAKIR